mgnify:FL=1
MYYPKSQISTNLYTPGGELENAFTGENYMGYYFKTSNGSYQSGKTPQSPGSIELILQRNGNNFKSPNLIKDSALLSQFNSDNILTPNSPNPKPIYIDGPYFNISNIDYLAKNISAPVNSVIYPTESDYINNRFQRYFLRKANNPIFKEVNKQTYTLYVNQDPSVQFDLYYPFKFLWTIAGKSKNEVANINYSILKLTEKRTKVSGLLTYFKNKLTEYYKIVGIQQNLKTDGTEYKVSATGLPYKGKYHIHPTKGAMVGATHTPKSHDSLDLIKSNITGSNITESINTPSPITIRGSFGGY